MKPCPTCNMSHIDVNYCLIWGVKFAWEFSRSSWPENKEETVWLRSRTQILPYKGHAPCERKGKAIPVSSSYRRKFFLELYSQKFQFGSPNDVVTPHNLSSDPDSDWENNWVLSPPLKKIFLFNHSRNGKTRTLRFTRELCLVGVRREALQLQEFCTRNRAVWRRTSLQESQLHKTQRMGRTLGPPWCCCVIRTVKELLTQFLPRHWQSLPNGGLFWMG